ncbi:hypothetical protein Tco_0231225 [Tanacetum coccineum]
MYHPFPWRHFQHDLISHLKLKGFSSYVCVALLTITGSLNTTLDLNNLSSDSPKDLRRQSAISHKSLATTLDEIQIDDKVHLIEEPVEIMDREVKRLKQSRIPIVKVRWNSRRGPEFTWEREDQMKKKYPHLFVNSTPKADVTS